jgi:hypothetical protein
MKTRREFLSDIGNLGKVAIASYVVGNTKAYSEETSFTLNPDIHSNAIYYGSIPDDGIINNLGVVYRSEILEETREYDELKKVEQGTAKYEILKSEAFNKANKAIVNYARDSTLDVLIEGSKISEDDLISFPESEHYGTKAEVFDHLNVTQEIIDNYL